MRDIAKSQSPSSNPLQNKQPSLILSFYSQLQKIQSQKCSKTKPVNHQHTPLYSHLFTMLPCLIKNNYVISSPIDRRVPSGYTFRSNSACWRKNQSLYL